MDRGKTQNLQRLVTNANQAYPDHLIRAAFKALEVDVARPRFLLATYIAGMLQELYDPNSSEEHNLQRVITGLQIGADELALVVVQLQRMRYALAYAS